MPEFGFVVTLEQGDDQEYRTAGNSLTAKEAVERCYSKYPSGRITQVLYGDVESVDLSPEEAREDYYPDDGSLEQHVDAPKDENGDPDGIVDEEDDDDATGVTESPIDPSDYSVADLELYLENEALSSSEIHALLQAEMDGKGRTTAVSAIKDAHPRVESVDE